MATTDVARLIGRLYRIGYYDQPVPEVTPEPPAAKNRTKASNGGGEPLPSPPPEEPPA